MKHTGKRSYHLLEGTVPVFQARAVRVCREARHTLRFVTKIRCLCILIFVELATRLDCIVTIRIGKYRLLQSSRLHEARGSSLGPEREAERETAIWTCRESKAHARLL